MSTKAIFLDLDGTLLNDSKEITAGNRLAIEKALKEGHKVIINTGRPLASAIKQAVKLGLTSEGCYLISFNGGIIYDMGNEKIIDETRIPFETVYKVFEEANKRKLHIQTYGDTQVIVEPQNDNENVRKYCSISLTEHMVIDDIHSLEKEPVKMLLIDYENKEPLADFAAWVNASFPNELYSFFSCPTYIEIMTYGLNKGTALIKLASLLNIPIENTIAAGDEANDLEMISAAGIGVAMKNATDQAKAVADYITQADNNNDGIAEVIYKFVLNSDASNH